jgi:signal transduction histidine kinase
LDTESKNKWKLGLLAFFFLLLFSYGLGNTKVDMRQMPYQVKSYFSTEPFAEEINDFMSLFEKTHLEAIDKEEARKYIEVSYEQIDNLRQKYFTQLDVELIAINEKYIPKINEATEKGDKQTRDQLESELNAEMEKINRKYNKTEDQLIAEIQEDELEVTQEELALATDRFNYKEDYIKYYIKDRAGTVYTNLGKEVSFEAVKKSSVYVKRFPYHTAENENLTSVNRFFITRKINGYIAIPPSTETHSLIIENMYDYQDQRNQFFLKFGLHLAALVISIIVGLKYRQRIFELIQPLRVPYNRIPIDVRLAVFGFSILFFLTLADLPAYDNFFVVLYSLIFAATVMQFIFLKPLLLNLQEVKEQWKGSIFLRLKSSLSASLVNRNSFIKILALLIGVYVLGFGIIGVVAEASFIVLYIPVVFITGLTLLILIVRKIAYYNTIMKAAEELTIGNHVKDLPIKGKGTLATLAGHINQLKHGVQSSQKAQAKSERLKTELISNVSHDLRTPLTSIINYTEFLKNKELGEQEREDYINIIDKKSKRLKVLIEDLFEVSKMASGDLELKLEDADIVQLMKQAIGEYDEKIKNSSLDFRVTSSHPQIFTKVDGNRMWRVFENIISNILNYSLDNTRVFIHSEETESSVVITFKNISKIDLKDNVDELFERFKRGDQSRNTDGSGLGLAIAKSILDHHGGDMRIEVDGDLFKTIVIIDKY